MAEPPQADAVSAGKLDFISRPGVEEITQRPRVAGLLDSLRIERALLSVQVDQRPVRYNSAILKVDLANAVFYLDELTPSDGHRRLHVGSRLRIVGAARGVPLSFRTGVEDKRTLQGVGVYRVALPEVIDYRQRRAYYRVHTPRALQLEVTMRNEEAELPGCGGRIVDLSLGGFGVVFPEKTPLQALDRILVDALQLPDNITVSGSGQVRWVHPQRAERLLRVGIRLDRLPPEQAHTLRQVLITLQREEIRRNVRN